MAGLGTSDEIGAVVHVLDTLTQRLLAHNQEMAQSRTEAQAANKAKSQFLANMSHEIRTPLNGVLGMSELLQGTELNKDQRRYADAIATSGRALHELLSNILDLSKIEAGKVEIETIDFDLTRLLKELASAYGEIGTARSNRITLHLALPAPAFFRGDPTRLRQVLSNLLGNAVKFTEAGTVTLEASALAARDYGPRTWLRFSVRDTGIGIAPDQLKNLFAPFAQADSSTTRKFGGTGLGLVISKHLVELLGGSMHVERNAGAGSRFWFDLPFAAADTAPESAHASVATASPGMAVRVLLAEDNPVNQEVIKAMLGKAGADVVVVDNGELAVQALRQREFDLVLMDCQMPVMDGYEATRLIRAEAAPGRRLPIIALTANTFAEDRAHCLAAGMDDYLTKPVTWDLLAQTVTRWAGAAAAVPLAVCASIAASAAALDLGEPQVGAVGPSPAFEPAAFQKSLPAGMGVDSALARKIIGLFISESAKLIAEIERAATAADTQAMFRAAHSLKSSAASVGALAFSAIARELETLARGGQTEALTRMSRP